MGLVYKGISEENLEIINLINNIFLGIFHIEALIKIIALKSYYFKDGWNKFDFFIIIITDIVLILSFFSLNSELKTLPIIARALRLGRIVKIIRASKSIRILIDTIYYLLPSLLNIGALIFLMIFIFSVLGMNLFSGVKITLNEENYPYLYTK